MPKLVPVNVLAVDGRSLDLIHDFLHGGFGRKSLPQFDERRRLPGHLHRDYPAPMDLPIIYQCRQN